MEKESSLYDFLGNGSYGSYEFENNSCLLHSIKFSGLDT